MRHEHQEAFMSMRAAVEALADTPHLLPLLFPGEP
jgi:hypothetical protein